MARYAAKTLYKNNHTDLFEERITIHEAKDWDDAWKLAKASAKAYAHRFEDDVIEDYGILELFHIFDDENGEGAEVYSVMLKTSESYDSIKRRYDWLYGDEPESRG